MADFKRTARKIGRGFDERGGFGRDKGGRSFGGRSSSGRGESRGFGRDRGFERTERHSRDEAFEVICDKCGEECTVPFKPTNSKPIYCNSCFKQKDNAPARAPSGSDELAEINRKLDKIMRALKIQ